METKRIPLEEQAAALLAAASTDTAPPKSGSTGRLGALTALVRPATSRLPARLLSWALLSALVGVLLLVALATLPTFLGYHNYIVSGGSMGASLPRGSVAVSKPTSPYALDIGDIIVRESPDRAPVLHRIVDIRVEEGVRIFITQGDVNTTPDPEPLIFQGPGDRVVYSIPYVGYVLHYAGTGPGQIALIVLPLVILAAILARERWETVRQAREARGAAASNAAVSERAPIRAITPAEPVEEKRPAMLPALREQLTRRRGANLEVPQQAEPGELREERRVA